MVLYKLLSMYAFTIEVCFCCFLIFYENGNTAAGLSLHIYEAPISVIYQLTKCKLQPGVVKYINLTGLIV